MGMAEIGGILSVLEPTNSFFATCMSMQQMLEPIYGSRLLQNRALGEEYVLRLASKRDNAAVSELQIFG